MSYTKDDLKRIREENNLTQADFAESLSITRELYNKMENGLRPISKSTQILLSQWIEKAASEKSTYTEQRRELKLSNKYEPIPYHDVDIAAGEATLHDDKNGVAEDYYYIPEFSGCRAFNCWGDSMDPLIKKGSKIFCKKIDNWQDFLEYGQVYVIGMTDGRRFIKYIKKGTLPDRFLLVSENKHYEDFEVPMRLVRSVWLIDGSMDKMTQSTFFILKYPNNNAAPEPLMTFGKHKGKKLSEVPAPYWRWLYDKHQRGEKVDEDIIKYIEESVADIRHQAENRDKTVPKT